MAYDINDLDRGPVPIKEHLQKQFQHHLRLPLTIITYLFKKLKNNRKEI